MKKKRRTKNNMLAIYRKELKLYLCTFNSYFCVALILMCFGIFSSIFNFFMGYSNISYPLVYFLPILMLIIPIPLMVAHSRNNKTGVALFSYSLSISPTKIVVGQYLAALTLFLIPTLAIGIFPIILSFNSLSLLF